MIKLNSIFRVVSEDSTMVEQFVILPVPFVSDMYRLVSMDTGKEACVSDMDGINEYIQGRDVCIALSDAQTIDKQAEYKAKQIMSKYVEDIFNNNNKQSYETLARKIINRFTKIGIVKPENVKTQFMKVTEELGELAEGINKDKPEQVKDSLGDVLVTLILLAEDLNLNLLDCLNSAWNEIKDRKGEVKDGSFVKEEDLDDR